MDLKLIGNRIKFLRINNTTYSQDEFAKIINVDRAYISRIETGKQNLTVESLIKICDGLNVSMKDFFDFDKIRFNS